MKFKQIFTSFIVSNHRIVFAKSKRIHIKAPPCEFDLHYNLGKVFTIFSYWFRWPLSRVSNSITTAIAQEGFEDGDRA